METQMVSLGAVLMIAGMGAVFVFLTLLVGATTLMSSMVIRARARTVRPDADHEEIAAISAAIARHRGR